MMSSIQTTLSCLLIIILAAPKNCHGFTTITTSSSPLHTTTKLHLAKESTYSSDNNDQEKQPSSDLKALLPKPASRPLKMDKFGRRIYRMEDDTTVRHTKGSSTDDDEKIVAGDCASSTGTGGAVGDGTSTNTMSTSSNLSNLLTDTKQLAGDKSLQAFENVISSSSTTTTATTDLKALLPTAKMRFMKLDKFGRRVQRMEDDGTVSYSRSFGGGGQGGEEKSGAIRGVMGGTFDEFTSDSEIQQQQEMAAVVAAAAVDKGQSLSKVISNPEPTTDLQKDASTSTGIHGADLKALLPSAKMRFMKLDKFGRRVQRMEDDGTVSYSRSERSGALGNGDGGDDGGVLEESSGGREESSPIGNLESESTIDLGTRQTSDSYVNESGTSANLKDLAGISKRPVFTKLDFKGGSVEDDRRMTSSSLVSPQVDNAGSAASASGLKELALSSKRPIFTKLDFKGGSVEDERRTKKAPSTDTAEASTTTKSNLKDLLPTRPTFTKLDFKGGNVEDESRTKKAPSTDTAEVSFSTKSNLKDLLPTRPTFTKLDFKGGNVEDERRTKKPPSSTDLTKTSSSGSLQTLLPERKFMWRKKEHRSTTNDFIGSVSGDFLARTTTSSNDSVREVKQKAMRDEVIASATAVEAPSDDVGDDVEDDESGSSEGGESYSNLTDLLPQKKFVFRDTK